MAKAVAVLAKFFNSNPENKKSLPEFASEVRKLSDAEKKELATDAAKVLGMTCDDC